MADSISLRGCRLDWAGKCFTGIRIGLAAARRYLGQSLRIPVVGVSSLELMAAGAATKAGFLSPQIDALRGQIFTALFERRSSGQVRRVLPEIMVTPDEWGKKFENAWNVNPFGFHRFRDVILMPRFCWNWRAPGW